METFLALLAICAGNLAVPGEFPTQRPVTRSFDVFFDLRLNKRLSKQWWGWWFETLSRPLWRHRNVHKLLYTAEYTEYLESTMATLVFDIWIYFKWLSTIHNQAGWLNIIPNVMEEKMKFAVPTIKDRQYNVQE